MENNDSNSQMNYQLVDIETWARKEHFYFYQQFEQPFFNICCNLKAKNLYQYCKSERISFFDAYLYLTMKALNHVEAFKYRLAGDDVRVYEHISMGVTQMASDDTFRFSEIAHANHFSSFTDIAKKAKTHAKNENFWSDRVQKNQQIKSTVYLTVIPWISFTSFSHARFGKDESGIPRLVFGKMDKASFNIPFSVDVHHSLVDGLHVGCLVELLQEYFDTPEEQVNIPGASPSANAELTS